MGQQSTQRQSHRDACVDQKSVHFLVFAPGAHQRLFRYHDLFRMVVPRMPASALHTYTGHAALNARNHVVQSQLFSADASRTSSGRLGRDVGAQSRLGAGNILGPVALIAGIVAGIVTVVR